jgi:hypothetical protein
MSVKAILISGHHNVQMWDYTYGSAVEGGDVVIDNNVTVIAHRPYDPDDDSKPATPQAAIRGGIYKLDKDGTSGPVFSAFDPVYVNASTGATTDGSDAPFGMAVEDAGANQDYVYAEHNPNYGYASS